MDDLSITDAQRYRGLFFLRLAVAAVGFTMSIQMGLKTNFVADVIGVSGPQLGVLEALRETCGVTAFVFLAILAGLAESIVASMVLLPLAGGLISYLFVGSYGSLVIASLIWSQGFHIWMPLPESMSLSLAEPGRAGHRLGQVRSAMSIGSGLALAVALVCVLCGVKIRPLYVLAGVISIVAAVSCLGIPRKIKTPGPRFVFRRRYTLYYVLSFLEGWRKQIFICFAAFLLVREYGTPLTTMLLLWMGVSAISFVASPSAGRLIDRIGERKTLVFYYIGLTAMFVGYAFIKNMYVLYAVFIVDSAFFVFATALTTYVKHIAPPSEYTPTLSMGVAMNHVAAVIMPLIGGALWIIGYKWTFGLGVVAAVLSIAVVTRMPKHNLPLNTVESNTI